MFKVSKMTILIVTCSKSEKWLIIMTFSKSAKWLLTCSKLGKWLLCFLICSNLAKWLIIMTCSKFVKWLVGLGSRLVGLNNYLDVCLLIKNVCKNYWFRLSMWYKATMGLLYGLKEMKIASKKGIWKWQNFISLRL